MPGLEVAAIYHPLGDGIELGGDFYDVWSLPDGRFGFAIGDATGTGPEAAALSAMVRFTLRALTTAGMAPGHALVKLNEMMVEAGASGPIGERFCTAVLGVVTPGPPCPRVVLTSGGHPYPLLRRAGGSEPEEVELQGSLLGLFEDPPVASVTVELSPGDLVALVTDGATEARRDGVMFGVEGVIGALAAAGSDAAGVVAAIEAAVLRHTGGELTDDLAALVLRATEAIEAT